MRLGEDPMGAAIDAERRRSERARCVLKAVYRLPGRDPRLTETRDLSDGGLLMLVSGDVRQGDVLDLKIRLGTEEDAIHASGRVVHLRDAPEAEGGKILAGIQFLGLNARHRKILGKAIWRRMLRESARLDTPR
jgi:c-di-GMP-binding flagellar brake protein YcgR